jgi:DNA-binding transcriptional MerR regulator
MFKIGEFSKLGLVSIKTLRLYDEMDLLKPAHIDPQTNYRYYTPEQLVRLNQIVALKQLGFTLAEVKTMLDDNISTDEMRGMLRLRQSQIEKEIEKELDRLRWVEAKLDFIEQGGRIPEASIVIKAVDEFQALTIREPAPGMGNWVPLIQETHDVLRGHGIRDISTCLALFHGAEFNHEMVDWELAFVLDNPDEQTIDLGEGRFLSPRHVPAVEMMASLVHQGSYSTLSQAYSTLGHWIKQNDYEIVGPAREIYLKIGFQRGDRDDNVTEIQFPVTNTT